jgi:O-antigen/teichoic acid export membrane protein
VFVIDVIKVNPSDLSHERSKKRTKRIKWSAFAGLASSCVIAFVSIFSAPITINYFGKDLYGIWAIISSFFMWAQLFDFGILNGLTNALSEAFGQDDYLSAQNYISTSFIATALIGCLGFVLWITGTLHFPWSHFIRVDTLEQANLLGKGICMVGCFFLCTLPFIAYQKILFARQRIYIFHAINLIVYLLTLVVLIVGVHQRFPFLPLLFVTSAVPLICHVICWCILTKKVAWARISCKHVHFSSLKRVAYSSVPLLVLQFINIITSQMIPILLTSVTTLKEVADFSILWKIYLFIVLMMGSISAAHNPGFRDAFERGEIDWIKKSVKRLAIWQTCLILIGCTPLLIAGNTIIETWIRMPLEYPLDFSRWCIFTLCILFGVFNFTLNGILTILDKIFLQVILTLLSSAVLCIGILIGVSRMGLITVFGIIGLTALISIFYSFRALKRVLQKKTAINTFGT